VYQHFEQFYSFLWEFTVHVGGNVNTKTSFYSSAGHVNIVCSICI